MTDGVRPFGVDEVDDVLGGGLPVGGLTALVAPPASQAELFLERLTSEHAALYVAVDRPAGEVLDQLAVADDDPEPTDVADASPGDLLYEGALGARDVPEDGVVVIDPVDGLEAGKREPYLRVLDHVRRAAARRDAAAIVRCHDGPDRPPLRSATLGRVDVVMEVTLRYEGQQVETYLGVPKFRGGSATDERLKLTLEDALAVDTSRDIA